MAEDELGECFRRAYEFVLASGRETGARLAHGMATGQPGTSAEGVRFSHAWVELGGGDVCLDVAGERPFVARCERYYELGSVDPAGVRRYTLDEMLDRAIEFRHYGPWDLPGSPPPVQEE